jgi:hypothetical protein
MKIEVSDIFINHFNHSRNYVNFIEILSVKMNAEILPNSFCAWYQAQYIMLHER